MRNATANCYKWYNVEIPYNTGESIKRADAFRNWLYENNFKHEPSACGDFVHFEIFMSADDVEMVNIALDRIVWFDTIREF